MLLFLAHQLQNWGSIGGATNKNYGFLATVHGPKIVVHYSSKVKKKN